MCPVAWSVLQSTVSGKPMYRVLQRIISPRPVGAHFGTSTLVGVLRLDKQPDCKRKRVQGSHMQCDFTDLKQHGNEGFDLQDLSALLHEQVVILEAQLQELAPLQGGVGTGHGHYLGLLGHQVVHPVCLTLQNKQVKSLSLLAIMIGLLWLSSWEAFGKHDGNLLASIRGAFLGGNAFLHCGNVLAVFNPDQLAA